MKDGVAMEDVSEKSTVIHLWCGPRSMSTCTMYSFSRRPDTKVIDEPLYAYWLKSNPHISRPYNEELFKAQNVDGNVVLKDVLEMKDKKIIFLKHITRQLDGLDDSVLFTKQSKHVFLVRNPLDMITGWNKMKDVHEEECSLETMSLPFMSQMYSKIRRLTGIEPLVVDSDLLKEHPREVLTELCDALGIPFYEEQLSWPKGPKEVDGLWASHWYGTVHTSTGFDSQYRSESCYAALSKEDLELYRDALPFYDLLVRKAIGRDPLNPGSSVNLVLKNTAGNSNGDIVIDHGIEMSTGGTHKKQKLSDERNAHVLAWVGDRLVPRELAKVSVFDSTVQGGDAVWEGLRVYDHSVFRLDKHIQRLLDSSKAMAFKNIPTREYIKEAVFKTLAANGMTNNAHIRLTLSRGAKITSSMNPLFNVFGCNLIVLAEWKPVGDAATYDNNKGIRLITAAGRRNGPQCVDSKIHHCNLINNILPKIQANVSGAADALMLDPEGFVSETNATNVFMVKRGQVLTPHADYCLPGITRQVVMNICTALNIPLVERRVSLAEFHSADEVFTTGTMGELTPVNEIDGREIRSNTISQGAFKVGDVTQRIQAAYRELTDKEGVKLPF